ncbi:cytochrome b/b6 domain-containing protein [Jannaschia aquimarina]|uniref:Lipid/polyisoprenoid-binding YceI-like domain-containing protein n=1 Tax=Jannaschia aquimarina TaxID=935700 RepID=A0A0D1EJU5_9RHOB|nr:cytochrome b/b6 domain-containing protein [Jannaschia aquimarina]KIT17266.1 hypothetical protein jaqu_09970 [Jannaschia aquimarina]SNT19327.1 Cytochrome b561 [Jannaschia aquimarina]
MSATNTETTYGWVERAFHWAIALLIPTAAVLGGVAYDWPYDTDAALATKATLFSAHKTVGLAVFFIALARIVWAITQPRPQPLHPDRRAETFVAGLVHWVLYGSLVLVPLTGWIHHATSEGFAPIWWPFGQSLPFFPKDPALSATFATLHITFKWVLIGALVLHIVGTIKHAVIDKDSTFARMWRGSDPGPLPASGRHTAPAIAALAVWGAALGVGLTVTSDQAPAAAAVQLEQAASDWVVQEGTLSIDVVQMGASVTGTFEDWTAVIAFDEAPRDDGTFGEVEVTVAIGSLTLGSVTSQATGAEFLDAGAFPTATFAATIQPGEATDYVADGTLTLRGVEMPLRLPFDLTLDGDTATVTGNTAVERLDFGVGTAYPDASNVGLTVDIAVALTATRAP